MYRKETATRIEKLSFSLRFFNRLLYNSQCQFIIEIDEKLASLWRGRDRNGQEVHWKTFLESIMVGYLPLKMTRNGWPSKKINWAFSLGWPIDCASIIIKEGKRDSTESFDTNNNMANNVTTSPCTDTVLSINRSWPYGDTWPILLKVTNLTTTANQWGQPGPGLARKLLTDKDQQCSLTLRCHLCRGFSAYFGLLCITSFQTILMSQSTATSVSVTTRWGERRLDTKASL